VTQPEPQPLSDPLAPPGRGDLEPTAFIELDDELVRRHVARAQAGAAGEHEVAARLFAAVRDGIRYDPYGIPTRPEAYRAGAVLRAGSGYCVQKAVALTSLARAAGIPSRLGFADVRNHLQTERLREMMGTDLFVWHGFSTLFVGGRWTKASPAFNRELCERFGVAPLGYDGSDDALLHAFSADGSRYMEYVHDHGVYRDLPLERILEAYLIAYRASAPG
jgi:transglutaminase-like putative cysteine protease